jgi:hypothetical protein
MNNTKFRLAAYAMFCHLLTHLQVEDWGIAVWAASLTILAVAGLKLTICCMETDGTPGDGSNDENIVMR